LTLSVLRATLDYVISPLKLLRGQRTIDAIAHRAHLNRNLIIRAEQATYSNPPPALVAFYLSDVHPINAAEFLTDLTLNYHLFQTFTRQSNGPHGHCVLDPDFFNSLDDLPPDLNPLTAWRAFSDVNSKARIATAFCIHLDIVQRCENRPHLIPNDLPSQYLTALAEAGYSSVGLEELNSAYRLFRANQRKLMRRAS